MNISAAPREAGIDRKYLRQLIVKLKAEAER
jgi:hypothetical protein